METVVISEAVRAAITAAVNAALLPARAALVTSIPEVDHDGDNVIRVRVVLDDMQDAVDGRKLLTAIVRVQDALQQLGEDRFAHLSLVSATDVEDKVA